MIICICSTNKDCNREGCQQCCRCNAPNKLENNGPTTPLALAMYWLRQRKDENAKFIEDHLRVLTDALKFYADPTTWEDHGYENGLHWVADHPIYEDKGAIARAGLGALALTKGPDNGDRSSQKEH